MASRNRGKGKPKLRDLSRLWPTKEEQNAVQAVLSKDNAEPIVVAILGVAMIEYQLEKMLRSKFRRSDDETWKDLTGENGPLSTFFAKITAGHAFGLYDDVLRDALHTARNIRNAFAHTKKLIDFNNELVIKELKAISLPTTKKSALYKRLVEVKEPDDEGQDAFIILCLTINNDLLSRQLRAQTSKLKALKARAKRRQSSFTQSPYFGALVASQLAPPQSEPINWLKWLAENQCGDPKLEALRALPQQSLLSDAVGPRSKDKKK